VLVLSQQLDKALLAQLWRINLVETQSDLQAHHWLALHAQTLPNQRKRLQKVEFVWTYERLQPKSVQPVKSDLRAHLLHEGTRQAIP